MNLCIVMLVWWIYVSVLIIKEVFATASARPHIIFILADDLGFNDVGFHGSNEIPTPNIDALAYSGLVLHNYYVTPLCTPSRAAIMTGKYPIHTGMQHTVIYGMEPRGLPLSEKLLPQYLKELGYKTHLIGKWHLGSYKTDYLPMKRGFDSHLGFWTGKIDMYDHTNMEKGTWGHDFRRGCKSADELFGQYATDIYTKEAVKLINSHNKSEPLFLMVAHSAVHSGNPSEPIRAPDQLVDKFSNISNYQRRKFAGVMSKLDESVGVILRTLQSNDMLNNSIVVFTTDNGGAADGFNDNAASNYPLRGVKNTLWEGGVRGAGLLWGGARVLRGRVAKQRLHLVDWLPTLYTAAGGDVTKLKNLDGLNLWKELSEDLPSKRTSIVHNIDNIWNNAAISIDQWKLVTGTNYNGTWDGWYGPSGRDGTYNYDRVYRSDAGVAIRKVLKMPTKEQIKRIREGGTVKCNINTPMYPCEPLVAPCLFNINDDPCERHNLAQQLPDILQMMLSELEKVNSTSVPPNNKPIEPQADPKYWGRVFTNFGDFLPLKPTCHS